MIPTARSICALAAVALVIATILSVEWIIASPKATTPQTVRATGFPQEWYDNGTYECSPEVKAKVNVNTSHPWQASTNFHSQGGEDRFVLDHFFHSSPGPSHTFVELGALDGKLFSNSLFFETVMGWRGLLIEPSTLNYVELEVNRPMATTLHMGVCERPGLLHVLGKGPMADSLEGNAAFHDGDHRSTCHCLPMRDVLEMVGFMGVIDYFSLDVQGPELQVIRSHDWVRHPVRVLSIEQFIGYHEHEYEAGRKSVEANRRALRERGLCRYHYKVTSASYDDDIWINPALFTH